MKFVFATLLLAGAAPLRAEGLAHRLYVSPAEIRTEDTRTLGRLLTERLRRVCATAKGGGAAVGEDSDLIMMVPASALASIVARGFRNRHETGTGGGFDLGGERFEAEQQLAMARLPYDRRGRELLPKYAVLSLRRPGFESLPLPARYGAVAVVFKKEVQSRTTWTYADSLDHSRLAGRFQKGGGANPVLPRSLSEPLPAGGPRACVHYCEAQIWGALDWSDVDHVVLRDGDPVPAGLRETGTPMYRDSAAARSELGLPPRFAAEPSPAAPSSTQAVAGLLRGESDSRLSDAALIRALEAAPRGARAGLLGELASRPKSAAVARGLSQAFGSADETERALALYGLGELPWERFKAYLLKGLDDASWTVRTEAIALAAERAGDADVAAGLARLRAENAGRPSDSAHPHAEDLDEWLSRLERTRFCE